MRITFEEVLSKKEWIHSELLNSLDGDTINEATKEGAYEVKLLVNGKELEPKFFNDLVNNIEKYIDSRAKQIVEDRLYEAEMKARKLEEMIKQATDYIREEFNIQSED